MTRSHERRSEMNRSKTRTCARLGVIRANGKVEQHILIFDPAELPSLNVNAFIELHPGDRLDDYFDLRDLTESNPSLSPLPRRGRVRLARSHCR